LVPSSAVPEGISQTGKEASDCCLMGTDVSAERLVLRSSGMGVQQDLGIS